ncbi:PTS fructose transporter subunit IIB [Halococcus hamelinensis]|uniref:Phosphotransferase system IIB component n=1 Tax=Halococcus hamelinensis 100A6 TaxID=1132509 RepID=M0MA53_9EURY|nr:PTS fructose transporter subunit IIB [Halococcus hamelinensis]EMA41285.1 phosphotransferase system IIB component [Halococcus hamelinensis 100A6]
MKLVAVTSCPTGIAHSQMAAESLEQTAEQLGHEIHVEIQGAMGAENELGKATIADADAAIIAADTAVSRDRFEAADVPVVKATVKAAINDTESLFERASEAVGDGEATDPETAEGEAAASGGSEDGETGSEVGANTEGLSPDQIGGDPRKGLFARVKRRFS